MTFVPFAGVWEVVMDHSEHGQHMLNILHFRTDEGTSINNANDLIDALIVWEDINCSPNRSSDSTLDIIRLRDLSAQDGLSTERQVIPAIQGGHGSPSCPGNVTAAITMRTANSGRSFRGRNYWIGLCNEDITGDSIDGAVVAGIVAAYEELLSGPIGERWTLGVASRVHNGAPRETGLFTPVQTFTMDTTVDSQRRRLTGRGR